MGHLRKLLWYFLAVGFDAAWLCLWAVGTCIASSREIFWSGGIKPLKIQSFIKAKRIMANMAKTHFLKTVEINPGITALWGMCTGPISARIETGSLFSHLLPFPFSPPTASEPLSKLEGQSRFEALPEALFPRNCQELTRLGAPWKGFVLRACLYMTCSAPVTVCVGHLLKTASNSSLTSQLSEPVTPVEANKRMTRILKKDKWIQGKSRQSFEKYSQVAGGYTSLWAMCKALCVSKTWGTPIFPSLPEGKSMYRSTKCGLRQSSVDYQSPHVFPTFDEKTQYIQEAPWTQVG